MEASDATSQPGSSPSSAKNGSSRGNNGNSHYSPQTASTAAAAAGSAGDRGSSGLKADAGPWFFSSEGGNQGGGGFGSHVESGGYSSDPFGEASSSSSSPRSATFPSSSPSSHPSSSSSPSDSPFPPPFGPYSHTQYMPDGRSYKYETVQDRLLNVMASLFRPIWTSSHTVAKVDLVRPSNRYRSRRDHRSRGEDSSRVPSAVQYRGDTWRGNLVQGIEHGLYGDGARLKLMQVWNSPEKDEKKMSLPWGVNFAVGANFDVESGQFQPKMRIKAPIHSVGFVALHAFPQPELELKGSWQLVKSLGITLRCRVPVRDFENFWEESSGALWSINLFNPIGSGFHLLPGGLEFDERVVRIGQHTAMRVAASVNFPKEIPWDDNSDAFQIRVNRLALKTRLL